MAIKMQANTTPTIPAEDKGAEPATSRNNSQVYSMKETNNSY